MRLLPLLLALLCAGPSRASDDWLGLAVPHALARPFELSLGLHQAQRETWALGSGYAWMADADGVFKVQRVVVGELGLAWQAGPWAGWTLAVPGVFSEMAPFAAPGAVLNFQPGDVNLRRSQGLGDLRLGLRLRAVETDGGDLGFSLEGTAPTGLGPFEAPHPQAATGEGRWALQAGLAAGLKTGHWQWRADLRSRLQFGKETVIPAGLPLDYDAVGPRFASPLGGAWLGHRSDHRAALGLGWDWFKGEDERHSLALLLIGLRQEASEIDGRHQADVSQSLALQPELHARFGALHALLAWQAPYLYADKTAAPDWGEFRLRLDHGF